MQPIQYTVDYLMDLNYATYYPNPLNVVTCQLTGTYCLHGIYTATERTRVKVMTTVPVRECLSNMQGNIVAIEVSIMALTPDNFVSIWDLVQRSESSTVSIIVNSTGTTKLLVGGVWSHHEDVTKESDPFVVYEKLLSLKPI